MVRVHYRVLDRLICESYRTKIFIKENLLGSNPKPTVTGGLIFYYLPYLSYFILEIVVTLLGANACTEWGYDSSLCEKRYTKSFSPYSVMANTAACQAVNRSSTLREGVFG